MRLSLGGALFVAALLDASSANPDPDADPFLTCEDVELRDLPFCDTSLSPEERAEDLVSRMTIEEKILQIGISAPALPRLGIEEYQYWSETLHGIAGEPAAPTSPGTSFAAPREPFSNATSFPQIINIGATFDRELVFTMYNLISSEARAFHNFGFMRGLLAFSPVNINVFRDPRWGRGQETVGEDPLWASEFARAAVRGMQFDPEVDDKHVKIAATCKHFIANDFEVFGDTDRHSFNALVAPKDFFETFSPPFEACIEADVEAFMCSYNAVNGKPMCANNELITDLLRGEWGFPGFVVSDCGAVDDLVRNHNYTDTLPNAVGASLVAGTDLDCSGNVENDPTPGITTYQMNAAQALAEGAFGVTEDHVTVAVQKIMRTRMRLGDFDPVSEQPYKTFTSDMVNTPKAHAVALEAALKSMVLLQNDNDALPFDPSKISSIAVIGPLAKAQSLMQGNYFGVPPFLISPLNGILRVNSTANMTVYTAQGSPINDPDTSGFDEARAAASKADVTVVFLGVDSESENGDRLDLLLPEIQVKLLSVLSAATRAHGGKLVAVTFCGGPLDYRQVIPLADGIIRAGFPGQSGGDAIAQVLFGEFNPSGRMPFTSYPNEWADVMSPLDYDLRKDLGYTYRFLNIEPVFPFGHGLSYTTFNVELQSERIQRISVAQWRESSTDNTLRIQLAVTNTGDLLGSTVLLVFRSGGPSDAPHKELVQFERADDLRPGEQRSVTFELDIRAFLLVNDDGERVLVPGQYQLKIEDVTVDVHLVS